MMGWIREHLWWSGIGLLLLLYVVLMVGGKRNELTDALDQKRLEPRDSVAISSTETVAPFLPIGMAEEEAISFLQNAGFKETSRFFERGRSDRRPITSEEYINFSYTRYEPWLFNSQTYFIQIAVTNQRVEQMYSRIEWNLFGAP